MSEKIKILFVCLGNICRSPTAHGIFEKLVKDARLEKNFEIDSAGTAAFHAGESPDARSTRHARKRGYDLSRQVSRKVEFSDILHFDHILAMDESNVEELMELAPREYHHKIKLMLEYASDDILKQINRGSKEVPDPYHEGEEGFEKVLDLLEDACVRLLESANAS